MNELQYKWCVAVADSALNGHIERCRTHIGALYTALIYRVARHQVKVYRSEEMTSRDALTIVQRRFEK